MTTRQKITTTRKFDVLPLIVLEHPWKAPTLHQFVQDVYARVRISSTEDATSQLSVGPLHVYIPETKPNVFNYLKRELHLTDVAVVQTCTEASKRECFLSLDLWKQTASLAHKVLVLDEYVALCGNPTRSILHYSLNYDWIGAVWSWASSEESPHHRGGNGALSIRNPLHLIAILESASAEKPTRGNEDMWFVKKLGEWEKQGSLRSNSTSTLSTPPKLASAIEQQSFAMETVIPPKNNQRGSVTPVGVFHLMRTVSYADREYILQICPEAKRLFRNVLHDGRCSLECASNFTSVKNYNQYQRYRKQEDFNSCRDICRVDHPFLEVMANWSIAEME
eukprot:CAMPEP_0194229104 /NCGR_PEP_ID=MMETSP0156-20130528/43718_1 /TAXON_ID=33649 /ORGANISM="Thalassionema nitzschioides, Strain L26-B" /LENGTH=335 /DNA_ID=CAMNT_0038961643 /DNA_START=263 /DNA_END=1270 /DNA_ORIENTATION=-